MVDARLLDGSRVNAIVPPLSLDGSILTIRKFAKDPFQASDLVEMGTFTPQVAAVLSACVEGGLNILVSGGTGTGKTTMLNVLSSFVPHDERIVTIEDAVELQLHQDHVIRLEARPANLEGVRARSPSGISSATASACGPTASSWVRSAVLRRWTCSRP